MGWEWAAVRSKCGREPAITRGPTGRGLPLQSARLARDGSLEARVRIRGVHWRSRVVPRRYFVGSRCGSRFPPYGSTFPRVRTALDMVEHHPIETHHQGGAGAGPPQSAPPVTFLAGDYRKSTDHSWLSSSTT